MESEQIFINHLKTQPMTNENIEMIKYFESQLKFKKQTINYKDKVTVTISFIKFIESICNKSNPVIFGSFTRNLIEKIFLSTSENGFADPINHDIDLVIYDDISCYLSDKNNFYDLISLFKIVSHNQTIDFDFNGYKIIDVTDKTLTECNIKNTDGFGKNLMLNIPHFTISLKKDDHIIKYDLLGHKIIHTTQNDTWLNEFNVNTLTFSNRGIHINNKENWKTYDFYYIINSILNREVVCNVNFESILQEFLFQSRNRKLSIMNQILWFLTYRTKILSLGYKKISSEKNFFDFKIEKEEICSISGNKPPYIKIKLKCGHYISLMGIAGIINIKHSEWSESIRCPCCRVDLELYLEKIDPIEIKIPIISLKEIIQMESYELSDVIISEENMNYVSYIMNNGTIDGEVITENDELGQSVIRRIDREDYSRAFSNIEPNTSSPIEPNTSSPIITRRQTGRTYP